MRLVQDELICANANETDFCISVKHYPSYWSTYIVVTIRPLFTSGPIYTLTILHTLALAPVAEQQQHTSWGVDNKYSMVIIVTHHLNDNKQTGDAIKEEYTKQA